MYKPRWLSRETTRPGCFFTDSIPTQTKVALHLFTEELDRYFWFIQGTYLQHNACNAIHHVSIIMSWKRSLKVLGVLIFDDVASLWNGRTCFRNNNYTSGVECAVQILNYENTQYSGANRHILDTIREYQTSTFIYILDHFTLCSNLRVLYVFPFRPHATSVLVLRDGGNKTRRVPVSRVGCCHAVSFSDARGIKQ